MAYFICEKQGRCCSHEFYNSIEQAITDSEDGVLCDHLIEVAPVRHGKWIDAYPNIEPNPMFMYGICSECGFEQGISKYLNYCPNCGANMDGGDGNSDICSKTI